MNESDDRDLESYKQEQDFLKHLVSLSTGAILLLVTFLQDLFKKPLGKSLVWWTLLGFTLSIVGSLFVHFFSIMDVNRKVENKISTKYPFTGVFFTLLCFGGFLTGLVSLVIFTLKNMA